MKFPKFLHKVNSNKKIEFSLVTIIVLLAAILRFSGISPGYPPTQADEGISHERGYAILKNLSLNPQKSTSSDPFTYPMMVPLLNAIFYLFVFIPSSITSFLLSHLKEISSYISHSGWDNFINIEIYKIYNNNILGFKNINIVFWGRYVTATFGILSVILTYFLSRRLFNNKYIGYLSTLLVAVNYRQVLNSHIGIPDIYNAFFLLLSFYWLIGLMNRQKTVDYLKAGLGIALYFSTKFQFFTVFTLLAILLIIFIRKKYYRKNLFWKFTAKILLLIAAALFPALLLNIYHLLSWRVVLSHLIYDAGKYNAGVFQLDFYPFSYLYHIGIGPLTSYLFLIGLVLGLFKYFKQIGLLLLTIIPLFWMWTYYSQGGFYTRNFVTITPLLLIMSAVGLFILMDILFKYLKIIGLWLWFFLLLFVVWESLSNSIVVAREYSQEWNSVSTVKWIAKNIKEKSSVITTSPELFSNPVIKLEVVNSPNELFLSGMQGKKYDYAVINLDYLSNYFYWWMRTGSATSLKFWNKPTQILFNTPLAEMLNQLKPYIVFESLNPWQAPDANYIIVKIPPKLDFSYGQLIYKQNFNNNQDWHIENDSFGLKNGFLWDKTSGYQDDGSLKINLIGSPLYSQRFVSEYIAVTAGEYQARYQIKFSGQLYNSGNGDGIVGVNLYANNNKQLATIIGSMINQENIWISRDFTFIVPEGAQYLQFFYQVLQSESPTFWLDDIELYKSNNLYEPEKVIYVSRLDLNSHLFLNSQAGM